MINQYLMIGEVLRPQGVRGEAKVQPWTDDPERFLTWDTLYVRDGGGWRALKARCSRVHGGFAYVTLEGCASPEDVDRLRGTELYIDRAHAAPLPEGQVYISDLIGCRAVDEEGREIGVLTEVLQNGPTDVYVFRTPTGTMMAPALRDAFPVLDPAHDLITVNAARLQEVAVFDD